MTCIHHWLLAYTTTAPPLFGRKRWRSTWYLVRRPTTSSSISSWSHGVWNKIPTSWKFWRSQKSYSAVTSVIVVLHRDAYDVYEFLLDTTVQLAGSLFSGMISGLFDNTFPFVPCRFTKKNQTVGQDVWQILPGVTLDFIRCYYRLMWTVFVICFGTHQTKWSGDISGLIRFNSLFTNSHLIPVYSWLLPHGTTLLEWKKRRIVDKQP